MRVIRPSALTGIQRRRASLLALTMLAVGVLAGQLTLIGAPSPTGTGVMAATAAMGLGVGSAWLARVLRPGRARGAADALIELLSPTFDDDYVLLVAPRLPVRDAARLDGILIGPPGVRVLTVRDWEGRYRVRGRVWEFDARGRRGWVRCRTNPSFDSIALAEGVGRWARDTGLPELPLRPTVAFPHRRSRIVLEEPSDEIVTAENAPWWANSIGRVRRLDPAATGRVLNDILDAVDARRDQPTSSPARSQDSAVR